MAESTDLITVELPQIGRRIERWKEYSYNSQFLEPTDQWSFTFGDDETGDAILRELSVGQRLTLKVNGTIQGDGYIDDVNVSTSRGGLDVTISGRDLLGHVVDGHIDPAQTFKAGETLESVLKHIFTPFGFTEFAIDNTANRNILTGQTRGTKVSKTSVSKRGKVRGGKPLKSFVLHQLRPYPSEGAFQFAARLAQRHGLWIWLAADNKTIVVGTPDFDQDPVAQVIHKRCAAGSVNTVIHGQVHRSAADQPSCIVASGRGAGGEHSRSGLRVIAVNGAVQADVSATIKKFAAGFGVVGFESARRLTGASGAQTSTAAPIGSLGGRRFDMRDDPFIVPILGKYPGATVIVIGEKFKTRYPVATARPLYLQDDESTTLAQLENFARREIALKQRKAFEAHYTVEGHAMNGVPWTVDTMVDVNDDVLDIHEPLYVLGRTFRKSRSGGTTTDIHLIRPGSLEF